MKKQYIILTSSSSYDLIGQVESYLRRGWEPLSGVAMTQRDSTTLFAQALVKTTHIGSDL